MRYPQLPIEDMCPVSGPWVRFALMNHAVVTCAGEPRPHCRRDRRPLQPTGGPLRNSAAVAAADSVDPSGVEGDRLEWSGVE